jgi:hypothetical protein
MMRFAERERMSPQPRLAAIVSGRLPIERAAPVPFFDAKPLILFASVGPAREIQQNHLTIRFQKWLDLTSQPLSALGSASREALEAQFLNLTLFPPSGLLEAAPNCIGWNGGRISELHGDKRFDEVEEVGFVVKRLSDELSP